MSKLMKAALFAAPVCIVLDEHKIVTSLCRGGKEWMRRLMNKIASEHVDLKLLATHLFGLEQIEEAYDLFANQRDGVLKIAVTP